MNRILFLILIICSASATAQPSPDPSSTPFDRFIKRADIEWAAWSNDTIWYNGFDLTKRLLQLSQENKIRIANPLTRADLTGQHFSYISKNELVKRLFPQGADSKTDFQTNRMDERSAYMQAAQILYVSNGKLYSYVPFISTMLSVYMINGNFIGNTPYFSTAINTREMFRSSAKDKINFIKRTKRSIVPDSFQKWDMLKQIYGKNILQSIWKWVTDKNNTFIDPQTGEKKKSIEAFNFLNRFAVPYYDSAGNIQGTRTVQEVLSPDLFKKMEITQDWYYNSTQNIVFNRITDIILYKEDAYNRPVPSIPVIKIIFK